eukprot:TRINITY_DN5295_c0_g1_i1.p1 TRINITY_DN5295_c0_g1~~TRINITY_DN5295_c0_g1_i1.p1  ORF type:complete len:213 (+),score=29.73 TRINITY_DN5295_c0_g1_i1:230-868(+)
MPSNQLFNSVPSAPEVAQTKPKKKNSFGKDKEDMKPKLHETNQALYKTELCHSFLETGHCRYAAKCQFAHGEHELRPLPRHMKYKTEICKTFHTIGTCPYGKRCRFIHKPREIQIPASLPRDVPPLTPLSPTGGSFNDRLANEIPSPADSPVLTSTPVGSPVLSPIASPVGSPVDPAGLLFLEPLQLADFEDLPMLPPVQAQSRLPIFASLC